MADLLKGLAAPMRAQAVNEAARLVALLPDLAPIRALLEQLRISAASVPRYGVAWDHGRETAASVGLGVSWFSDRATLGALVGEPLAQVRLDVKGW